MKGVYQIKQGGREFIGTKKELNEVHGFSKNYIDKGEGSKLIGFQFKEFKYEKDDQVIVGHAYHISELTGRSQKSARVYMKPTGRQVIMLLDEFYERGLRRPGFSAGSIKRDELNITNVKEICGRMKYLNNRGAEPEWQPTEPMIHILEQHKIDFEELKEVPC